MKIAVAGATGVVGRHVVPRLLERGHAVRGVARDPKDAEALKNLGAEALVADLFDPATLLPLIEGCDAAMHLATAIPPPARHPDWSMNDRIRTEGTRSLVAACHAGGVSRYVQQSIAFLTGGTSDLLDEDAPLLQGNEVTSSAIAMEAVVSASGLDWSIIRDGALYGPGTGREEGWLAQARNGDLRVPASGSGYVSLVHVADLAAAFVAAVELPDLCTTLAVVDDEPVTYRELFDYITASHGLAPAEPGASETMPTFRISNARARTRLDWRPAYPSYRSGLAGLR